MLPMRHLMVRRLHLEPHLLQGRDDLPPRDLPLIHRGEIEVATHIVRQRRRAAIGGRTEQKELRLHPRIHHVPHRLGPRDLPLEHLTRISGEGLSLWRGHIADHARYPLTRLPPREDPEGREVGAQQHVRLLHPHEPLDARAVKHDVAGECLPEL